MKVDVKNEFLVINALSLLLALLIANGGSGPLRVMLALPFVLFFPGYALVSVLFPKKSDLPGIERVALSLGMSIVIVPLLGLVLNYTPWGINLATIFISVFSFIAVMSILVLLRRKKLAPGERFSICINFNYAGWNESSKISKILSLALIAVAVIFIGSIYYMSDESKVIDRFTQFHILGPSGKAEGYPREMLRGQEKKVILVIFNHEYRTVNYRVEVRMGGYLKKNLGPIAIGHGCEWEGPVFFSALEPHEKVKVEFLLFKEEDIKPCCSLHLWVKVI